MTVPLATPGCRVRSAGSSGASAARQVGAARHVASDGAVVASRFPLLDDAPAEMAGMKFAAGDARFTRKNI